MHSDIKSYILVTHHKFSYPVPIWDQKGAIIIVFISTFLSPFVSIVDHSLSPE